MSDAKKFILVPIDGSDASQRAAEWAKKIALTLDAGVRLLSVLDLSQLDVYDGFYLTEKQLTDLKSRMRNEILDEIEAKLGSDVSVEKELIRGKASSSIIHAAEHDDVVMVCIGKTGKGAVARLLQGSVSRDVVNHIEVPCTVIS
ncbi:MAG: universal stress protein [Deltaproteobacteria bacterium]|nr:universal stress protein [Deltaproteobacteria bacterium]